MAAAMVVAEMVAAAAAVETEEVVMEDEAAAEAERVEAVTEEASTEAEEEEAGWEGAVVEKVGSGEKEAGFERRRGQTAKRWVHAKRLDPLYLFTLTPRVGSSRDLSYM